MSSAENIATPIASVPDEGSSSHTLKKPAALITLGLITLTFLIYLPTLHNSFVNFDDDFYIYANPHVQQGLTWHGVVWAFTSTEGGNWLPATWLSFMSTASLFGISPFAYHATNLLLHILNVVLLFLMLGKATGQLARSTVVAALFAVFPLNVEAVAWATERKSVLSTAFFFSALFAYGWYTRRPSVGRYLAVVVAFALGLMTKAWFVSFPFALLLLDFWPLARLGTNEQGETNRLSFGAVFTRLVWEKIPLFLMAFADIAIAIWAARKGGAFTIATARAPFTLRFENALWSYFGYIKKALWPTSLAIVYPFPTQLFAIWKVLFAATFLIAISAVVWLCRRHRYLITGWLWFLGVLFPLIGFVQTGPQSMADRWAYLSFLGLFVVAVWGLSDWFATVKIPRAAIAGVTAGVLTAYGAIALVQTTYWRDGFTVFSHAVAVTGVNGPARVNLGAQYEQMGRMDLAMAQYQQAVLDMPTLSTAHYNYARLLDDNNRQPEAIAELNLALENTTEPAELARVHNNLGSIYSRQGHRDEAFSEFSLAIDCDPTNVYALLNRGMSEYNKHDLGSAEQDFYRSVQQQPTPMTWYTLGMIREEEGKPEGAREAYEAALHLKPDLTDAAERLQKLQHPPLP